MQQAPPEKVKKLLVLHFGLFLTLLLSALVSLLLVSLKVFEVKVTGYHGEIVLTAAILSLIAFLLSRLLYKKQLRSIEQDKTNLHDKLDLLLKANLRRWIILEVACILCVILFLLTQVYDVFILIIGLVIVFYLTRPTAMNIASDLNVREHDILSL